MHATHTPRFLDLPCHEQTPDLFVVTAGAEDLLGSGLRFSFCIKDDGAVLRLPEPCHPERRDGLWRHTCCEVFMATPGSDAYREFNFSPSGEWAAYDFSAYRQQSSVGFLPQIAPPKIHIERQGSVWRLETIIAAESLPASGSGFHVGLSVVLEAGDGNISYHALHHAASVPDFHRRESFTLFIQKAK